MDDIDFVVQDKVKWHFPKEEKPLLAEKLHQYVIILKSLRKNLPGWGGENLPAS